MYQSLARRSYDCQKRMLAANKPMFPELAGEHILEIAQPFVFSYYTIVSLYYTLFKILLQWQRQRQKCIAQ